MFYGGEEREEMDGKEQEKGGKSNSGNAGSIAAGVLVPLSCHCYTCGCNPNLFEEVYKSYFMSILF